MVYTDPSAVPSFVRFKLGGDRGQCQNCGLRTKTERHSYAMISGFSLVANAPSGLELVSALVRGTGEECDQTRAGRRQSDGVKLQYPFLAKGQNLLCGGYIAVHEFSSERPAQFLSLYLAELRKE